MNFVEKVYKTIQSLSTEYFTAKQLRGVFGTSSTLERQALAEALDQLEQQRKIVFDLTNRRYRLPKQGEFGEAVFQGNARGFGFLLMEDGNDLFVPASKTHGAFHRDVVLFRRVPNTKDEAEVVSIISRGTTELVGTYDTTNNTRFVLPDDKKFVSDVYVSPQKHLGAKHGQKVVVKITHFPSDNRNSPEGEIVQVLGFPDEKNVDMLSVAHSFGLSREFPQNVEARVSKIPQTVDEKSLVGRRDLRNQCIFTIDGDDAKDLDDAVSISTDGVGNFVLGVHIADVSHYVKPGDDVDKEAFNRGTSVYFPETVFPMLPTALSNGICSLFQGVDRLTLSCQMTVNARGKVVDYEIFPSVINSCRRMTYANVQRIFDGDKGALAEFSDVVAPLMQMKQLAEILQNKRSKRGNIDFVSKEVYFVHDNDGNVVDVLPYPHSFANQLIEEFMILANETVAEFAQVCDYPFVYRIHEKPDEQKLAVLYSLMAGVGISVKHSQEVHSSVLQDALAKAEGTPYFNLINDVMLRTMQKAKYSTFNSRHFGLASNCYCHFTSPIRRYADLTVHRIIKTAVTGKMTDKALCAYEQIASDSAQQSSARERIAIEAERKADDVKKCKYAQRIVGQSFWAIVSGVTEHGLFAQLPNTVEGFVSVERLGGYFVFNKEKFCLASDHARYSLGDKIAITVLSANVETTKIDFDLAKDIDNIQQ